MSELDGEPFVAFDPDLSIRRAIDRFLRHHDVQVEVVLEFDNIENIKRAVEIPSGVSILPEPSLAQRGQGGDAGRGPDRGRRIPDDRLTRPLAIIHRRHGSLEPAAAKFLELLIGETVEDVADRPTAGRAVAASTSP